MTSRNHCEVAYTVIAAVAFSALLVLLPIPYNIETHPSGLWSQYTHFITNESFPWLLPPTFYTITSGIFGALVVFLTGWWHCSGLFFAASVILLASLFSFLGNDLIVVSLLLGFTVANQLYQANKKLLSLVCAILIAQQLAPLIITIVLIISHKEELHSKKGFRQPLFFLLASMVGILLTPLPWFPHIPDNTRLVPDDGVVGVIRPLIGPTQPHYQLIDRQALKTLFLFPILALLATFWRAKSLLLLLLVGSLAVDTVFYEFLSIIGPIHTLRRVIPQWFFFSLTPSLYALTLLLLLHALNRKKDYLGVSLVSTASILGAVLHLSYQNPHSIYYYTDRFSNFLQTEAHILSTQDRRFGSSTNTFIRYPLPLLALTRDVALHRLLPTRILTIEGSPKNGPSEQFVVDRDPNTYWSTGEPFQSGQESLLVRLPRPYPISGIKVLTGYFPSDFPRGFIVEYTMDQNCNSDWKQVIEIPSWLGTLSKSESGALYFGDQANVNLFFRKSYDAACIRFKNTVPNQNFEWRVAELRLFSESKE